jgi:hypothetical protein
MHGITLALFTILMDAFKDIFSNAILKLADNKETSILPQSS